MSEMTTLPPIVIHDGPITFAEAWGRLGDGSSIIGYNAVWPSPTDNPENQWKALHVSDGGGSEWSADSRESAVAHIHEAVGRSFGFWSKKVRWRADGDRDDEGRKVVRVDGRHYVIGEEPSERALRSGACGFGGHLFAFKLLADGTEIRSRNVWTQGVIPAEFRDALPDNAEQAEVLDGTGETPEAPHEPGCDPRQSGCCSCAGEAQEAARLCYVCQEPTGRGDHEPCDAEMQAIVRTEAQEARP